MSKSLETQRNFRLFIFDSTGYSWFFVPSTANNALKATNVDENGRGAFAAKQVPKGFVGAGGNFNFKFNAPVKPSNELISLTFEYKRPWEGVAVRRVVVMVKVN